MKPTREQIDSAFALIDRVLGPVMTRPTVPDISTGRIDAEVEAARVAFQSLCLLRQWARAAANISTSEESGT